MEEMRHLVSATGLRKEFVVENSPIKSKRKTICPVDNIDIDIDEGEIVGLVGESGCGKSSLGKTLLRMHSVDGGQLIFDGEDITNLKSRQLYPIYRKMQMVYQDPYSALNPRMSVLNAVKAPLDAYHIGTRSERNEKVLDLLEKVGLGRMQAEKMPHELSGGQRQRVVIARALSLDPKFIVCDEAVSALDVSVRAQVINLLKKLQLEYNLAYLFISHDLSVIRYLCDRVVVMYLGQIVESAEKRELFEHPMHPYTRALLSAIPIPDVNVHTEKIILNGDIPNPAKLPSGCRFCTRCPEAASICSETESELKEVAPAHMVRCCKCR